jgi:hypothetical protein
VLVDSLDVTPEVLRQGTGWEITPQGACKGDVCVPLSRDAFDFGAVAERLGMAVVHDPELGVWAVGPETVSGRALTTATAPELVLPDLDGNEYRLSSSRGTKVVLVSWAPY